MLQAANPLPQALVLTAIVIGFALMCFALVLVMQLVRRVGTDDALALRLVEPADRIVNRRWPSMPSMPTTMRGRRGPT